MKDNMEKKKQQVGPKTIKICNGCRFFKLNQESYNWFAHCLLDIVSINTYMTSQKEPIVKTPDWCKYSK